MVSVVVVVKNVLVLFKPDRRRRGNQWANLASFQQICMTPNNEIFANSTSTQKPPGFQYKPFMDLRCWLCQAVGSGIQSYCPTNPRWPFTPSWPPILIPRCGFQAIPGRNHGTPHWNYMKPRLVSRELPTRWDGRLLVQPVSFDVRYFKTSFTSSMTWHLRPYVNQSSPTNTRSAQYIS